MTEGKVIQMEEKKELPQGVQAYMQSLQALYDAVFEIHAPFLNRHPGIHDCYNEAVRKIREARLYIQESVNMIQHPELYPAPGEMSDGSEEKEDGNQ